ncbi:hypothetical protein Bca52824_072017 [Brassica carinata]|uniref:Uncharacterized protein n=1 Tax=Brassica carinata TaxID=52824 RepID=A0A8X7Q837_BRACI|nr:hypothetical protein Bca52824_072017 [Brassica carinata]
MKEPTFLCDDAVERKLAGIKIYKESRGDYEEIQDPIPGEEEAEADPVQEEYERNIEAIENEADDEELWSGAGKQTMYSDDLICDEMYNPIDPFGIRKEKEIGAKRKGWLDDAEKNVASFGCVETGEASSSHGCKRQRCSLNQNSGEAYALSSLSTQTGVSAADLLASYLITPKSHVQIPKLDTVQNLNFIPVSSPQTAPSLLGPSPPVVSQVGSQTPTTENPQTNPITWADRANLSTDKTLKRMSTTPPSISQEGIPRVMIPDEVFERGALQHKDFVVARVQRSTVLASSLCHDSAVSPCPQRPPAPKLHCFAKPQTPLLCVSQLAGAAIINLDHLSSPPSRDHTRTVAVSQSLSVAARQT